MDACWVPLIFMHMYRLFHLGRGAVYTLTLIKIFFHRKNFLHRLSSIIMGLETKCLCPAGIFRNWIPIKFFANNSRQHICVPFIFCHCSIWSPLLTKADIYFFMLMWLLLHINMLRWLTVRKTGQLSTNLPFLLRLAHCVPVILPIFYWQILSSFMPKNSQWSLLLVWESGVLS